MKNFLKNQFTITWIICLIVFIGIAFVPNKYTTTRSEKCIVIDRMVFQTGRFNETTQFALVLKNDKGEICIGDVGKTNYFSTKVGDHTDYMLSDSNFKRGDNIINILFHSIIPLILGICCIICFFISIFDII